MAWIEGARVVAEGRVRDVCFEGGRIVAHRSGERIDGRGLFLVPALIDAHVHLRFAGEPREVARALLRSGVAGVLDLGAPLAALPELAALPLRVRFSGPLLTAPGGYPTRSWGRDGYGLEIATPDEARAAVARVQAAGARFVKLAFDARFALLDAAVARAAVDEAHARGLLAAAHALDADAVRRALGAGCDVLAHGAGVAPWTLSTLHACGLDPAALRGARVVYGTDLGNENTAPGVSAQELRLLAQVLPPAGVLRAATSEAAALLDWPDLGHLGPGAAASLLALREDPLLDVTALARREFVLIDGAPPE